MATNQNDHFSVEDLISLTENFSCADNRLALPSPEENSVSFELTFIGKIIAPKSFSTMVVKDITQRAWNLSSLVTISKVDKHLFLFSFECSSDLDLVFLRRLWTLRGAHLVLKRCIPDLHWQEMDFSLSTFWAQVHRLPASWQKTGYLRNIGSKLGTFLSYEPLDDDRPSWKKNNRLRIDVDISKPLIPGFFLARAGRVDLWIGIKYEKLPETCFKCGVISHLAKDCNFPTSTLSNQFGYRFPAYGAWISSDVDGSPPGIYERIPSPPLTGSPAKISAVKPLVNKHNAILVPSEYSRDNASTSHGSSMCPKPIGSSPPRTSHVVDVIQDKISDATI